MPICQGHFPSQQTISYIIIYIVAIILKRICLWSFFQSPINELYMFSPILSLTILFSIHWELNVAISNNWLWWSCTEPFNKRQQLASPKFNSSYHILRPLFCVSSKCSQCSHCVNILTSPNFKTHWSPDSCRIFHPTLSLFPLFTFNEQSLWKQVLAFDLTSLHPSFSSTCLMDLLST